MSQKPDFRGLFLDEAREQLDLFAHGLLKLKADKDNIKSLNEIFRTAHTLKGSADLEGYNDMRDILHEIEDVLQKINNHNIELTDEVIDILLVCIDDLQDMITPLTKKKKSKIDILNLIRELKSKSFETTEPKQTERVYEKQRAGLTSSMISRVLQGFEKGLSLFEITVVFEEDDSMRSARSSLIYKNCLELGEVIKTVPDMKDVELGQIVIERFKIFLLSSRLNEEIKRIIDPGGIKAIDVAQIQRHDLHKMAQKINAVAIARASESNSGGFRSSIRIDSQQLDEFIYKLKELNLDYTKLHQLTQSLNRTKLAKRLLIPQRETVTRLGKLLDDLLMISFYFATQPLELIFQRLERLIEDLSRHQGKEIIFMASADHITLDKNVIDKIVGILLHLVRNAVDHGIELPDERLKLGKSKTGKIILIASTEDDYLVIQFIDDGRGLDIFLIKQVAIERKIINPDEAEKMNNEETVNLIFKPGFSTKGDISQTSGRGIGMDVVFDMVREMNGQLSYQSEQNRGVKFIIKFPLSVCQRKQKEIVSMSKEAIEA